MAAIGILTNPILPSIPRVDTFKGEAYHTARWPKGPVSFKDKKVAIIGTGATGIQSIQEIVKTVGHLIVFQRTPNWACPMYNAPIDTEEMDSICKNYPDLIELCNDAYLGFMHEAESRATYEVSPEERDALWEKLYHTRGFGIWFSNFRDVGTDREANRKCSEFVANKIRQWVKDPVTAEKLIPKNRGFATRGVPLETHYYECYNRENVRLIDGKETPIEFISEKGIRTSAEDMEFDIIIYATGFDAVTGSYDAIDSRGGQKPYLGLVIEKFPNMSMVLGPHQAYGNNPRSIEYAVEWVTEFLRYCYDHDITYAEPTKEGVNKWT